MKRIAKELQFADGLVLEAGRPVSPFDPKGNHRFSSDDIAAARATARRLQDESGQPAVITAVNGYLRVISSRFLKG